jgi:hypothetical protein
MQQHQTTPTNIYKEHNGRQMLLSCGLIRSYYPKLASQVKHILMDSGARKRNKDTDNFLVTV